MNVICQSFVFKLLVVLEYSWQVFYSATEYTQDNFAPGKMSLKNIGLKLESIVSDNNIHGFVLSNISNGLVGNNDSVIIISLRGTASAKNLKTELKLNQVYIDVLCSFFILLICQIGLHINFQTIKMIRFNSNIFR